MGCRLRNREKLHFSASTYISMLIFTDLPYSTTLTLTICVLVTYVSDTTPTVQYGTLGVCVYQYNNVTVKLEIMDMPGDERLFSAINSR